MATHEDKKQAVRHDYASCYGGCIGVYPLMRQGAVMEEAVRWNIKVSKDTDLTLRTFLGSRGVKKGDLSKFIEDAVRRRVLQCSI